VIILAAGQGSRLKPLTDYTPKPLLPIAGSSVLIRLIDRVSAQPVSNITIVVGHEKERVKNEVFNAFGNRVRIVENDRYLEDTNILSLVLALAENESPFIVFESDVVFEDSSLDLIFDSRLQSFSSWYTIGPFQLNQVGGILKANQEGWVTDLRIVKQFEDQYRDYKKLVGILKVSENEAPRYIKLLHAAALKNTRQYYLMPWINNLDKLPCIETDLSKTRVGAFNTIEEYEAMLRLFKS
jgi:choline kinase